MRLPAGIEFHERPHPSANSIVLCAVRDVALVDAGFVAAYSHTRQIVDRALALGGRLESLLLTHWHSDHAGGAGLLQRDYGVRVVGHRAEAEPVNARDPEACDAEWLQHPLPPYRVDETLDDGSIVQAGGFRLRAIHLPGQTPGHVAFLDEEHGVLLSGDMLQAGDVAWLPPMGDDLSPLRDAMASVERLRQLGARVVLPGHGGPIAEPQRAIEATLERYQRWLAEPELAAWHALNRICVSALMIAPDTDIARLPWLRDYARVLELQPARLAEKLITRLRDAGAITGDEGRPRVSVPFAVPDPLPGGPLRPGEWPPCNIRA